MLSSRQMDLKNGKGTIAAAKDGMLLLSIIYDPNMQIYVDGKKVDGKSIQWAYRCKAFGRDTYGYYEISDSAGCRREQFFLY